MERKVFWTLIGLFFLCVGLLILPGNHFLGVGILVTGAFVCLGSAIVIQLLKGKLTGNKLLGITVVVAFVATYLFDPQFQEVVIRGVEHKLHISP